MSPAKLTDRFLAYLIDTVPFGAGYHASLIVLAGRMGVLPDTPRARAAAALAWLGLYLLYHAVGNAAGCTLGKWVLGLRVAGPDGGRLAPWRAVVRSLGLLLSTPLCNLGFFWAVLNPESRTWHDLLAGSRVVEARPKSMAAALASALLAVGLFFGIIGLDAWYYLVRPTPEEVAAVDRARDGLEVLARIQEEHRSRTGTYTDRIADLALVSGDVEAFRSSMRELYDARGFRMLANRKRYFISGRARDRRRTVVSIEGPRPSSAP